ncbi:MAG: hypothetical protein RJB13_771 [Pseudomonadota bacterium]
MSRSIAAKEVNLLLLSVTLLLSHSALASELSASALNALLAAGSLSVGESLKENDCEVLAAVLQDNQPGSRRFKEAAQATFDSRCRGKNEENDKGQVASDEPIDHVQKFQIWDGDAICRTADDRIQACEHGSFNGRGLFVYSSSQSLENRPSLVCAHFELNYRSPFEYEQLIDGRCVVTEFDWRYESARSDVHGIQNWLKTDVNHSALEIPAALKTQCSLVFPDAIYCTPTFIVFPEPDDSRVGVCRLRTHDRVLGLGAIFRIGRWNSQWDCQSVSMLVPDRDSRLSVGERACIPDHLGQLQTSFCRLPYMPVARRPVRTYMEW